MPYALMAAGIVGIIGWAVAFILFHMNKYWVVASALLTLAIGFVAPALPSQSPTARNAAFLPVEYDIGYFWLILCATYCCILSVIYGIRHYHTVDKQRKVGSVDWNKAMMLGFWVIVPPLWFVCEYFIVLNHAHIVVDKDGFERFKYGQEVASKMWVAIVTLLGGLYFGKDFTPLKSPK